MGIGVGQAGKVVTNMIPTVQVLFFSFKNQLQTNCWWILCYRPWGPDHMQYIFFENRGDVTIVPSGIWQVVVCPVLSEIPCK